MPERPGIEPNLFHDTDNDSLTHIPECYSQLSRTPAWLFLLPRPAWAGTENDQDRCAMAGRVARRLPISMP
jgi:hypothetical protein